MFYYKTIFRKLFSVKTKIDFPANYVTNKIFLEQIDVGPVLVVGDFTGRDYSLIKERINETYLLDVVDNKIADKKFFIHQSVAEPIKFPDGYFRYVIMAEVIEHIWEDKKSLEEINRILSNDGKLLMSVPFFNDFAQYHYHIYSPKTIKLLLEHSGFCIKKIDYRGLITSIPNEIVALLALLLFPFLGKNSLMAVNKFFYKIHKLLANQSILNKHFKSYGAIIVAEKSPIKIDSIEIQKKSFGINI